MDSPVGTRPNLCLAVSSLYSLAPTVPSPLSAEDLVSLPCREYQNQPPSQFGVQRKCLISIKFTDTSQLLIGLQPELLETTKVADRMSNNALLCSDKAMILLIQHRVNVVVALSSRFRRHGDQRMIRNRQQGGGGGSDSR